MQHAAEAGKGIADGIRPAMPRSYRYCPCCGTALTRQGLHGRERLVCPACQFIFWHNPVVGVAVIVMQGDHIVLARRARGVYKGAWCIPCGYVEYDEDVRQAAQREFQEETGLLVERGNVQALARAIRLRSILLIGSCIH